MGIYINLYDGRNHKLPFFNESAACGDIHKVTVEEFKAHPPGSGGKWGVAVVSNGSFDAAAVAFDSRKVQDFTNSRDHRSKSYFICPQEWVEKVDPMGAGAELRRIKK